MRAVLPAVAFGVLLLVIVGGVMLALASRTATTPRRRETPGWLAEWLAARRRAARDRADAATPWRAFSRPDGDQWVIGVRRRTDDGRILDEHAMERIPITTPEYERLARVLDAESRARQFNRERVGM